MALEHDAAPSVRAASTCSPAGGGRCRSETGAPSRPRHRGRLRLHSNWLGRKGAPTGRNAHSRVLLRTPPGMKMLAGAGTPYDLMVRWLGAPVSDRHAARRAATTYCPRAKWRWNTTPRHPCVPQVRVRPPEAGGAGQRPALQVVPVIGRGLHLHSKWPGRRGASTGRHAHSRVLLRTPPGMKMLAGAGTPYEPDGPQAWSAGLRPARGPGGPQPRTAPGRNGAGTRRRAIRACSKYVFARRRRAVPVRDRRSKRSPSSGEAALTQQVAG